MDLFHFISAAVEEPHHGQLTGLAIQTGKHYRTGGEYQWLISIFIDQSVVAGI